MNAHIGQIMDFATKSNERFIVDRRGEPAVVIVNGQDILRTTVPPPEWLEKAWSGAKRLGLDTLTPAMSMTGLPRTCVNRTRSPPVGVK
jgi:hypothetical protein